MTAQLTFREIKEWIQDQKWFKESKNLENDVLEFGQTLVRGGIIDKNFTSEEVEDILDEDVPSSQQNFQD